MANIHIIFRLMILDKGSIHWSLWKEAYDWDVSNVLRVYPKLTREHVELTNASKMRNFLAENALDSNMMNLFVNFKDTEQCRKRGNDIVQRKNCVSTVLCWLYILATYKH